MKNGRRWVMGAIATGVLCGSCRQGYAGEFGGFDIDIGAGEEIFDNWEEEPEENVEKPEVREEEPEENAEKPEVREEEPEENAEKPEVKEEPKGEKEKLEVRKEEPKREEGKPEVRKEEPKREEEKPEVRKEEPKREEGKPEVRKEEPKREEGKPEVRKEEPKREEGKPEKRERKQKGKKKIKQKTSKKEKVRDANDNRKNRFTAFGTVCTAIGMAKLSPELQYYNNNDEYFEKTQAEKEYSNKTIYFQHECAIPEGEYPKIKIVNTKEKQDVTILSVRLNQEESSWYLEGDTLVLEQPVTEKNNVVELIALADGKMLISMPVWEFCYLDDIKK